MTPANEELIRQLDLDVKKCPDAAGLVYDVDSIIEVTGSSMMPNVTERLRLVKKSTKAEQEFLFCLYRLYKAWPEIKRLLGDAEEFGLTESGRIEEQEKNLP
jgi:hypothetical protein